MVEPLMNSEEQLLKFAKIITGHFSNKKQALLNSRDFAHINIYFRPLKWHIFKGPGFYSEQSYSHDPWRPYRQGIHKLTHENGIFKLLNFGVTRAERLAGAGFEPSLLDELSPDQLIERAGCTMHFREISSGKYCGEVEPGRACLVPRDGKLTYLVSEVNVDLFSWVSKDQGFDPATNELCWGSEHGSLIFERISKINNELDANWISSNTKSEEQ